MNEQCPTGPVDRLLMQMQSLGKFRRESSEIFDSLTSREIQILTLIAEGMDNPSIAKQLGIARVTVQNHRASIRQKLYIRSTADYLKFALAFDLVGF